jgi:hypothetical protein
MFFCPYQSPTTAFTLASGPCSSPHPPECALRLPPPFSTPSRTRRASAPLHTLQSTVHASHSHSRLALAHARSPPHISRVQFAPRTPSLDLLLRTSSVCTSPHTLERASPLSRPPITYIGSPHLPISLKSGFAPCAPLSTSSRSHWALACPPQERGPQCENVIHRALQQRAQ